MKKNKLSPGLYRMCVRSHSKFCEALIVVISVTDCSVTEWVLVTGVNEWCNSVPLQICFFIDELERL